MHKYQLIADEIKQKIYTGEYKPGEKLPSIQRFSAESSYHGETIVKAYKLLEAEHLIFAVPKSGYYVVKSMGNRSGRDSLINMNKVSAPDRINPYLDYCHCMENAINVYEKRLFEYSDPKGMPELIQGLTKHLMGFNLFTRAENLFVTNGAQQALFILGSMPFPNGRTTVLVEQPTYSVMLQVLKCSNVPVAGIRRTLEGLDLDELETLFKRGDIKFFYTMPRYQNPTGYSYSASQKRDIVELARKYEIYIVEDDYLADLELDAKAEPLYGMGEKELILHVRSFSKTLLPGLRLGLCILPARLREVFLSYKQSIDLNTPILTQGALEIYLKSKMYKFHIQRTKKHYKEKMDLLRKEWGAPIWENINWYIPPTGLFAYLETGRIQAERFSRGLSNRGVLVSPTNNCYLDGFPHPEGLRFCLCNIDDNGIRKVVDIVKQELQCQSCWF